MTCVSATSINLTGLPVTWWCFNMKMISTLLVLCEGNPPVTGGFPSQKTSNEELSCFPSLVLAWTSCWTDSRVASNLRCHAAYVTSLYHLNMFMWSGHILQSFCLYQRNKMEFSCPVCCYWLAATCATFECCWHAKEALIQGRPWTIIGS